MKKVYLLEVTVTYAEDMYQDRNSIVKIATNRDKLVKWLSTHIDDALETENIYREDDLDEFDFKPGEDHAHGEYDEGMMVVDVDIREMPVDDLD